ncbi:MAG: nucleoside triphosphate pyrophosphohydrolase family protein [Methylovulum sp.]
MNKHLKLVRDFHSACSHPQAVYGSNARLSDMEIITRQSMLMENGCEVLDAIKAGEMVEILAGLVNLAYCALGAIAVHGGEVVESPVTWRHDGFVLSLIRLLSDRINQCTSGNTEDYSKVYCLCVHLSSSFLNADFDKAFLVIHDNNLSRFRETGESIYDDAEKLRSLKLLETPDLSDYLYE